MRSHAVTSNDAVSLGRTDTNVLMMISGVRFSILVTLGMTSVLNSDRVRLAVRGSKLAMVFEYADQGDLHRFLEGQRASGKYLSERQALSLFRQIAAGVQHLHANGVVHRDLIPANILFMEKGEDGERVVAVSAGGSHYLMVSNFGRLYSFGALLITSLLPFFSLPLFFVLSLPFFVVFPLL